MKANVILGCDGWKHEGFTLCSGTRNVVLDLEGIEQTPNYIALIKYLDDNVRLFDGPCFKPHLITNAIYKMFQLKYINESKYKTIGFFYDLHKRCGLILEIRPKGAKDASSKISTSNTASS